MSNDACFSIVVVCHRIAWNKNNKNWNENKLKPLALFSFIKNVKVLDYSVDFLG
jgi:hypothetical protein